MTTTRKVFRIGTFLNDFDIDRRVAEVSEYERFSVFNFEFRSEAQYDQVLESDDIIVTSSDGTEYLGYIEDWDDSKYFVNLR